MTRLLMMPPLVALAMLDPTFANVSDPPAASGSGSQNAHKRAAEPKERFLVPGAGHVDLHDRVNLIPFDKRTESFRGNLS